LLTESVRARLRAAILEPVGGLPTHVNVEIINAHIASDVLKKYTHDNENAPPAINLPGAAEFANEKLNGIQMYTSWPTTENVHMRRLPKEPLMDVDSAQFNQLSAYLRPNRSGEVVVAPTLIISLNLISYLGHGVLPSSATDEGMTDTNSGAVIDACWLNTVKIEEAVHQPARRFVKPPAILHKESNHLVLKALLPHAHGLIVLQGEDATRSLHTLPDCTVDKVPVQDLTRAGLSPDEAGLINYPMGQSRNSNWGIFVHTDRQTQKVNLVVSLPSLTNLVPNSTNPVSPQVLFRFSTALAVLGRFIRTIAGLPTTLPVEEAALKFRTCLRAEYQSVAQRMLNASAGTPHSLTPSFVPPSVAGGRASNGGLATMASHGPQLRNGGLATMASHGPQLGNCAHKIGTKFKQNLMTSAQSERLKALYHVKHPESTLGYCFNCPRELPFGRINQSRALSMCAGCHKSFSVPLTKL
jgi:hypothetical protein